MRHFVFITLGLLSATLIAGAGYQTTQACVGDCECKQVSCECDPGGCHEIQDGGTGYCVYSEVRIARSCQSSQTQGATCSEVFDNEDPMLCCKRFRKILPTGSSCITWGGHRCVNGTFDAYWGPQIPNSCTNGGGGPGPGPGPGGGDPGGKDL